MKQLAKSVYLPNIFEIKHLLHYCFLIYPKILPNNSVRYKSVRYLEGFLWKFDRNSAGS